MIRTNLATLKGAWLQLLALTVFSVAVAESLHIPNLMMVIVFIIAMVKAQLVARHFMEVTHAAPHWRRLYFGWIFAAGSLLIAGHLLVV